MTRTGRRGAGLGRRMVATALVGAMLTPSAAFAGGRLKRVTGPGAAATLAEWSRVQQTPLSEDVALATDTSVERVMLLAVDETEIVVLATDSAGLPRPAVRALRAVGKENPRLLARRSASSPVKRGDVLIGASGVFLKGQHLADLASVVRHIPREEVRSIQGKVSVRGNGALAMLGGLAGFGLGGQVAGRVDRRSHDLGAAIAAWVAITAGAALVAGSAGTHETEGVIYERLGPQ